MIVALCACALACGSTEDATPRGTAPNPTPPTRVVTCRPDDRRLTTATSACSPADVEPVAAEVPEVFRVHVLTSSSLHGAVARVVDNLLSAVVLCTIEATVRAVLGENYVCTATKYRASGAYRLNDGVYTIGASDKVTFFKKTLTESDARAEVRVFWDRDTATARKGDLVKDDLADLESYLRNARFTASGQKARIEFDGPGPLVELLGLGPTPTSPLVVTEALATQLKERLGALEAEGTTHVGLFDCDVRSTIDTLLPRTTLNDLSARGIRAVFEKGEAVREAGSGRPAERGVIRRYEIVSPVKNPSIPVGTVDIDLLDNARYRSGSVALLETELYASSLTLSCGN